MSLYCLGILREGCSALGTDDRLFLIAVKKAAKYEP